MKYFILVSMFILSFPVGAADLDHQYMMDNYSKKMTVQEKTYIKDEILKLYAGSGLDSIADSSSVRKDFINDVLDTADNRYWIMGWLWAIHKESIKSALDDDYSKLAVLDIDQIHNHAVDAVEPTKDNIGQWLMDKYVQTFDYHGNLVKLDAAIQRFELGVCTDHKPSSRDSFSDGTEIVGGVVSWIVATACVLPVDPSFGMLTLFVAQPTGFIVGDYIGMKLGMIIWDKKCLNKNTEIADQKELDEFIAAQ